LARKNLPDGDELADDEIGKHAHAEQLMADLKNLSPADPRFEQLLGRLIADIRHQIHHVESALLPRLQAACSCQELRASGRKMLRMKEIAPTCPHPTAPDPPQTNLVLTPGTSIVDHVRDALKTQCPGAGHQNNGC
jgi:hypothetical protein